MKNAAGVAWDLSFLYKHIDDPAIDEDFQDARKRGIKFANIYKGTIAREDVAAEWVLSAWKDMEDIFTIIMRPWTFAQLLFLADATDENARKLLNKAQQEMSTVYSMVMFFERNELIALSSKTIERLAASPVLEKYRYWLIDKHKWRAFKLSEAEEQIIVQKDQTGKHAWERLYQEYITRIEVPLKGDGAEKLTPLSESWSHLKNPDREVRKKIYENIQDTVSKHMFVFTSIFNNLAQDYLFDCQMRNIESPLKKRAIADNITIETIETMIHVVDKNMPIMHQYFSLYSRLLKLSPLKPCDFSIEPIQKVEMSFNDAKDTILNSFSEFDEDFARKARYCFDNKLIDAEIRPGKQNAGYSFKIYGKEPVIIMNYRDTLASASILCHELGHSVHFLYSRDKQPFVTCMNISSTIAETASIMAEMLFNDYLIKHSSDHFFRKRILLGELDDLVGIFNQVRLTQFETEVYDKISSGSLTSSEIGSIWKEKTAAYYGDFVDTSTGGTENGWVSVGYFFTNPFVNYSYAFARLFVIALFQKYQEDPLGFVPGYKELLEAGNQFPPDVLARNMGIDLSDEDFWAAGIQYIKKRIDEFEMLIDD